MSLYTKIINALYAKWDTLSDKRKAAANEVYRKINSSDMTIKQLEEVVG